MPQEFAAERPNRAPTHPGAILREDVLPALAIPVKTLADHLKVSRQQVHRILATESDISPEMAIKLGKLCGNGPQIWMRMQEAHSLWHAAQAIGDGIDAIPTLKPKVAA